MMKILRRSTSATIFLAMAAAIAMLLFSDTAGAMFGDVVDLVRNAGQRFEERSGLDLLDRSQIPGRADQIGHAFFWGTIMLAIGWLLRSRVPIALTGLAIAAMSLLSELAQPLLSKHRAAEAGDAVANVLGITFATLTLLVVVTALRRWHGDDRRYFGDGGFVDGDRVSDTGYEDEPTDELLLPG